MICILLIEDNLGDARLIRELYNEADAGNDGYTITHVQRIRDAIKVLSTNQNVDLILSDITLPDSESLGTLQALKRTASQLPVIFMTGTNNESLALAAMNAGAQDYLVKGRIESEVLARATRYAIDRKRVQNEISATIDEANAIKQNAELLQQQKKQLLALNRAKDEFISLSSHQLRTPATGVKQYLGMILEGYAGEVPEHLKVFIRTAYDSNERQLTVINDLLKTAQIDSGRYELTKQLSDMKQLVEETVAEYEPIMAMRQQKIVCSFSKDNRVLVDPAEIKLVLSNLLENASKYSQEGSIIEIKLHRGKEYFCTSFKDHGVGIAKTDIKKIFEKFIRVDNQLSDTVSGSGLGLYFVKRIIKMHGGTLEVQSEEGKGSTFIIKLPYGTSTT